MTSHTSREFGAELSHIHDWEHRFLAMQQEMRFKAADTLFKAEMEMHIARTQNQIENLCQIYDLLGLEPPCGGTGRDEHSNDIGLLAASELNLSAGDAALGEHFEVGVYERLINEAQALGQTEVAALLRQNLEREQGRARGCGELLMLPIASHRRPTA